MENITKQNNHNSTNKPNITHKPNSTDTKFIITNTDITLSYNTEQYKHLESSIKLVSEDKVIVLLEGLNHVNSYDYNIAINRLYNMHKTQEDISNQNLILVYDSREEMYECIYEDLKNAIVNGAYINLKLLKSILTQQQYYKLVNLQQQLIRYLMILKTRVNGKPYIYIETRLKYNKADYTIKSQNNLTSSTQNHYIIQIENTTDIKQTIKTYIDKIIQYKHIGIKTELTTNINNLDAVLNNLTGEAIKLNYVDLLNNTSELFREVYSRLCTVRYLLNKTNSNLITKLKQFV